MPITIQPYAPEHLNGVLAVLAQAMPRDPINATRFTRQVLLDLNFRREGAGVACQQQQVVGFCLALARQVPLENAPPDNERGYLTLLGVAPNVQRQGIGRQLLAHVEQYLRAQSCKLVLVSPYAPGYFIPGVDVQAYSSGLAFLQTQGYREISRPLAMERPLWDCEVPPAVVENIAQLQGAGVVVESYRVELTLPLLEWVQREFGGDWVRFARDAMHDILQGDAPTRLFIAHHNGAVLGFAHHRHERFGPIGIDSTQRGRGIGQALLYATLNAMREQGLRTAWFLWTDDATAAGFYVGAGFQEVRRFAILGKEL